MSVQKFATERNGQIELLVDFSILQVSDLLAKNGIIKVAARPVHQKGFIRDDCSDVFDHYIELEFLKPIGSLTGIVQFWGQTTNYKGNDNNEAEPNKTYEIRETLIEGLGARRWLLEEKKAFRTFHITVGPSNYAYGWFSLAKDRSYDLSIYPTDDGDIENVFLEVSKLLAGVKFDFEANDRFKTAVDDPSSKAGALIRQIRDRILSWITRGAPISTDANNQAEILSVLRAEQQAALTRANSQVSEGGANIKPETVIVLNGGESKDPALIKTIARLLSKNPFLPAALEAESDWSVWSRKNLEIPTGADLVVFIKHLWTTSVPNRLIHRRQLLRLSSNDSIKYIQDLGVPGVTEHNLYGGEHTPAQVEKIVSKLAASYKALGVDIPSKLVLRLSDNNALAQLKNSRKAEGINGTGLRPSFFYVEEALANDFKLVNIQDTKLPSPVGYHSRFGNVNVGPYENMKAVIRKRDQRVVALIKGKYFRRPEFPRRAKEEAYVGLTTKFDYQGGKFTPRYTVPLVMFVDMDSKLTPQPYAVTKLVTCGWDVFFSVRRLREYLESLQGVEA